MAVKRAARTQAETVAEQPQAETMKVETISLDQTYVDERWQRTRQDRTHFLISPANRDYVTPEKFNPAFGLMPHVAYVGHLPDAPDKYHIIDGQHLIERARREGYTSLPMKAFYDLTEREISEAFLTIRRRVEVKGLDAFTQQVNAGYTWAITLQTILKYYGWSTDNHNDHYFKAVNVARKLLVNPANAKQTAEQREDALRFAFGVLTAAWHYKPNSAHQSILTALTLVYRRPDFRLIDVSNLIEKLSQVPPETLMFEAHKPDATGSSLAKKVANQIIVVYNKSKKARRLPLI